MLDRLSGQRRGECLVQTRALQSLAQGGEVHLALLGCGQVGRRERGGPHCVDDDPADRKPVLGEVGDRVDRLLHRHLLEQRHQVHGSQLALEDRHHPVALVLERTDLGQPADLVRDVEEPGHPAGRRRVQDDGVVVGPARRL